MGLATPITGAATISIKTAQGATTLVSGTTRLGRTVVNLVKNLQTIKPTKESVNLRTRIFNARFGSTMSTTTTTYSIAVATYQLYDEYQQAFAEDFAGQTSNFVNDEINRHYHPDTALFLKKVWAEAQFAELAEQNAWEVVDFSLTVVSLVDITGVTALINAYLKPTCLQIFPFPCIEADILLPQCVP
jgi:hypothetical protein